MVPSNAIIGLSGLCLFLYPLGELWFPISNYLIHKQLLQVNSCLVVCMGLKILKGTAAGKMKSCKEHIRQLDRSC